VRLQNRWSCTLVPTGNVQSIIGGIPHEEFIAASLHGCNPDRMERLTHISPSRARQRC
jgi:hypothetical protein